jgi:NDP-sugar pyrophosphorylase family protein
VLVLNGDSFCAEPLEDFVIWHQRRGEPRAASLLVTWVEDAARYGTVDLDDADGIVAFREKNGRNAPGWINTGAYLLSQHLLSSIPAQGVTSFEHDVFPDWAGRGLAGYRVRAPFVDIGTPDSYTQAETWLAQHLRTGCPQGSAS